jgi:hypothetical protein
MGLCGRAVLGVAEHGVASDRCSGRENTTVGVQVIHRVWGVAFR